jgi:hypothetical protein
MSFGGGNFFGKLLGLSESNSLVRMGLVPGSSAQDILAPGMRAVTEDIPKMFEKPEMPGVEPLPEFKADNSAALKEAARLESERIRKRKGMKSTVLTGMDQAMMQPAQTQKAELLG